ncbi:uncharacterized protein LOC119169768 [Rhipicephalus microplus]|uniref:uncharacterized protein LOC119169768 n=1 Tax=Rhipicephalus microplus TaxID=6941 RepID=UPI003F6A934F
MSSGSGFVCSDHFLPQDYETNLNVLRSLGFDTKNARLKRDAIPTQNLLLDAPLKKLRRCEIWQQEQDKLFRQLHGCSVDLGGDGRCDSSGFSDKFMTYSLHVTQVNKILHFEQVQVGEKVVFVNPGTPAHKKFADVVMAPRLLKDIRPLALSTHSFSLEAFHSVLIDIAPKSACFSPDGMRARTQLSVLHFNENSSNRQAVTTK